MINLPVSVAAQVHHRVMNCIQSLVRGWKYSTKEFDVGWLFEDFQISFHPSEKSEKQG